MKNHLYHDILNCTTNCQIHNTKETEMKILNTLITFPAYQKKATMCDALCHAIESFWSVNSKVDSKYRNELSLIEVKYSIGSRKDLARPTKTALENNQSFMEYIGRIDMQ